MKCAARTVSDVQKSYENGVKKGINDTVEYMMMVTAMYLADKRGWKEESIRKCLKYIEKTMKEITEGRIKFEDIKCMLKEEYDIEIKFK